MSFKINFSLILVAVSASWKNLRKKQETKNSFPIAEINDWLKDIFQLKNKLLPLAIVDRCLKNLKKMVSTLARKSVTSVK